MERNTLFAVALVGIVAFALTLSALWYVAVTRPLLRRLAQDRAHVEELARELGFHTAVRYGRTFAFGDYQGQRYVFWGPHLRRTGFSYTHEYIVATQTTTPGRSHVAAMFGADVAEEIFDTKEQFVEVTHVIPSSATVQDVMAAMTLLAVRGG